MDWGAGLMAVFATLWLTACAGDRILVVIDSDLQPTEISRIEVLAQSTDVASVHTDLAPAPLPTSALLERGGGSAPDVRIHVRAVDQDGIPIVAHTAVTRFVSGRTLRLDVPLGRDCIGVEACSDEEATCLEGACVPWDVDPASLPDGDPGADPPPLFDGPSEPDAGVGDAGPSCVEGARCTVDDPCRLGEMSCADVPTCESTGTMPEGTPCGEGRACDAEGTCGVRL